MSRIKNGLLIIDKWISIICIMINLIILQANVIGRYLFQKPIAWGEELGRGLLVVMIYLSISYCVHTKSHIRIDAAMNLYPKKIRPYILLLGDFIWLFYSVIIAFYGFNYTLSMYALGSRLIAINVPVWPFFLAIPVGHLCMGIRVLMGIIEQATGRIKPEQDKVAEGGAGS